MSKAKKAADSAVPVQHIVMPRIEGPVAESWVIARGVPPKTEWLTPDRKWQGSIFEAARFELDERKKVEWWLKREIDSTTST